MSVLDPATGPVPALDVLVSATWGVRVTVAVPQSLATDCWAVGVLTQALLVNVAAREAGEAATVVRSTMGAPTVPPAGIGNAPVYVHEAVVAVDASQFQPVAAATGSVRVNPAGMGSLTVMVPLTNGPSVEMFLTTRVKSTASPALAWLGLAVLVKVRSGATTFVLLLLDVTGAPTIPGAEKLNVLV